MFPPFPQELAHQCCTNLISRLENGDATLNQIGKESAERKEQGLMLGALFCQHQVTGENIILYSLSGNSKELIINKSGDFTSIGLGKLSEIVVPSIVETKEIEQALLQYDKEIHLLTDKINALKPGEEKSSLINKRKELTDISLQRVFDLYSFTRFDKKQITLNEIIKKHNGRLPPTGTGDCCGPKLLSYAFSHDLQPISMDEVYYGKNTKTKENGKSYPPCDDRCGYILPDILGVEILYRDKDIIVVNKESGLLSVPGRGPEKADSVETRVRVLFPNTIKQPAVHRLDMETSGIIILAFNKDSHRELNKQFAEGLVEKKYMALLDGILRGIPEGKIELKTRLDVDNRPHQIVDNENGKLGITNWKKLGVKTVKNYITGEEKKATIIEFVPITGRTHQLRLAAACKEGMGIPIIGDTLYGNKKEGERLMLHAFYIRFTHPITNKEIELNIPVPF